MLPRPKGDVIFKELSEGGVLFDTGQEVYFGLNPVGCLVWKLLTAEHRDLDGLSAAVHARFPEVPLDTIRVDVDELLDELVAHGLTTGGEEARDTSTAPLPAG